MSDLRLRTPPSNNMSFEEEEDKLALLAALEEESIEKNDGPFPGTKIWKDLDGIRWSINLVGKVLKEMTPDSFKLVSFEDAPAFLQDNRFIRSGYRAFYSTKMCFQSVFKLHNETMNIWTHLLGFVLFNIFMWYTVVSSLQFWQDKLVFIVWLLSAQYCLASSFSFHTFCCKSHKTARTFSCIDHTGVSVLIGGSFLAVSYFVFKDRMIPQIVYVSASVITTAAVGTLPFFSWFHSTKLFVFRAMLYLVFGALGVIPVLHWLLSLPEISWDAIKIILWLTGNLFYVLGVTVFYLGRIPERFWPGRFDIWGASHQIWHISIITAALCHYKGIVLASEFAMIA